MGPLLSQVTDRIAWEVGIRQVDRLSKGVWVEDSAIWNEGYLLLNLKEFHVGDSSLWNISKAVAVVVCVLIQGVF